mgnify:CR=1 FL=1
MQSVWDFIQTQILGMAWLRSLIHAALTGLGLPENNRWVGSLEFFLYDAVKITLLLCLLIFIISYIQSHFPPERSKKILSRFHGVGANILAALLGTVTPFCSCSSIPLISPIFRRCIACKSSIYFSVCMRSHNIYTAKTKKGLTTDHFEIFVL